MNKHVVVIAGHTASGESTVTKALMARHDIFDRLVTATTRPPRNQEEEGVDYYFFSAEEFQEHVENGNILEHTYIADRDVYYGTYKPDLEKRIASGRIIIVNPDLVGAKFYKEQYNATTFFLRTVSDTVTRDRLMHRDVDITDEELEQRMAYARYELQEEGPFYDHIIVNKDGALEDTLEEIEGILEKNGYDLTKKS